MVARGDGVVVILGKSDARTARQSNVSVNAANEDILKRVFGVGQRIPPTLQRQERLLKTVIRWSHSLEGLFVWPSKYCVASVMTAGKVTVSHRSKPLTERASIVTSHAKSTQKSQVV